MLAMAIIWATLNTHINSTENNYLNTESINYFAPAANAGVRIGVGRTHKNIEIRLSYIEWVN